MHSYSYLQEGGDFLQEDQISDQNQSHKFDGEGKEKQKETKH